MRAEDAFKLNNPLEFHLTDHCNMNCKYCAHYSPVAKPRYSTMEELSEALGVLRIIKPKRVHLLGGEPLLHPDIDEVLQFVGKNMPQDVKTFLITNGLLLEKMTDGFWDIVKKYDIRILLSIYPVKIDYQSLILYAASKEVMLSGLNRPRIKFRAVRLKEKKRNDPEHAYSSCKVKCLQIRDGRIYPCSYSAYFEHINKHYGTSFQHTDGDYLPIDQISSGKQLEEWMRHPKPLCAYCNCGEESLVRWETVAKHCLNEWVEIEE